MFGEKAGGEGNDLQSQGIWSIGSLHCLSVPSYYSIPGKPFRKWQRKRRRRKKRVRERKRRRRGEERRWWFRRMRKRRKRNIRRRRRRRRRKRNRRKRKKRRRRREMRMKDLNLIVSHPLGSSTLIVGL